MNKETFCASPFGSLFLGPDGGIRFCCSLPDDLGNIKDSSIESILQSPIAKSIRQSIIDEKWHPKCSMSCKIIENTGGRAERNPDLLQSFLENCPADSVESDYFRLQHLDLRWTNTCQLQCTYCSPYFSSKWVTTDNMIPIGKVSSEDSVLQYVADNREFVNTVNMLGGEPLLQKAYLKLFELLKNQKLQSYYLLSNLSVDLTNNKIAEKLFEMDNIHWGVSFETIGERFEHVRHNAKWDTLVKNIRILKERQPHKINTHPLYSAYSALHMCEYYDFLLSENCFETAHWQLMLSHPELNVFMWPKALKHKALIELEKCITTYGDAFDMTLMKTIYNGLLNSPEGEPLTATPWLDSLDASIAPGKKADFFRLWPELII